MDSAAAPIVVSGDSSSESEEPSNVPVVPSSSTAANSSSPDPSLLERLLAPQQSELSRKRAVGRIEQSQEGSPCPASL